MDLIEHHGKELFRRYDIPTPPAGVLASDPEEVERAAAEAGVPVMVKAQVLTGGRGKAGGVRHCADPAAARAAAEDVLGLDIKGHVTRKVLVEPATDIAEEYYLSLLHDRVSKGYKVIASVEGGVDIEEVNRRSPDKVVKLDLDPTDPLDREQAGRIVEQAGFPGAAADQAADLLVRLHEAFVDADATLMEINPLVLTGDGRVLALDSKVSIDGAALFRHPDLADLQEVSVADPLEARASEEGLQYVRLDGEVGVIGNGAGLVMSTLDVVSEAGGSPANFLDVGGGADAERMARALALVLSDERVRVVLVNIFGGITRCDEVAEGVLGALEQVGEGGEPLVVRLDGTNAEQGREILERAAHPRVVAAGQMLEAAERAVGLAKEA